VGKFELLESLAKGGMALVYKARERSTGALVALKVLPSERALDPEFGGRFEREAETLATLHHPNIVACLEFGRERDLLYLAMELVEGCSLRQLASERALSALEIVGLVTQVCDGLAYAHDRAIVHRDIKPENLLVDGAHRVKIADFGLAKILEADPGSPSGGLTMTGSTLGTTQYMAPEQAENPRAVDGRADLYSVGAILYELLTGRLPVGRFDPPNHLRRVTMRALSPDPAHRPATALELRAELLAESGE